MVKDPVCNMMVDETKTKLKSEHEGKVFYFCSQGLQGHLRPRPAQVWAPEVESGSALALLQIFLAGARRAQGVLVRLARADVYRLLDRVDEYLPVAQRPRRGH